MTKLLSAMEMASFLAELNEADGRIFGEHALEQFLLITEYVGFDPIKIITALLSRAKDKVQRKELMEDMAWLIRLTLSRGTNARSTGKSMFTRMNPEGVEKAKRLIAKWGIVTDKPTSQLEPTDVTLSRLIAVFSPYTAQILRNEAFFQRTTYARVDVTTPMLEGEGDPSKLPYHLRFPGSNALYPENQEMQLNYLAWSKRFAHLISPKKPDPADVIEFSRKVTHFAEITRNSNPARIFNLSKESLAKLLE